MGFDDFHQNPNKTQYKIQQKCCKKYQKSSKNRDFSSFFGIFAAFLLYFVLCFMGSDEAYVACTINSISTNSTEKLAKMTQIVDL